MYVMYVVGMHDLSWMNVCSSTGMNVRKLECEWSKFTNIFSHKNV